MSENWDFYPCRVEEAPASIMVNLGIARELPLESLTDCAWLHVTLNDPRDDGLSSREEFDRLIEIGDALEQAIADSPTEMRYVGRCTSRGRRDFYTYAESGHGAESILATMMAAFPEYQFETGFRSDPEWQLYGQFLYPTPPSMQLINNRRVLDVLEKEGDDGKAPRPVQHFAYFETEDNADEFARRVEADGYQIVSRRTDDETDLHSVVFERTDAVDFVAINQLTLELLELATGLDGRYDGWETQVQRPATDDAEAQSQADESDDARDSA